MKRDYTYRLILISIVLCFSAMSSDLFGQAIELDTVPSDSFCIAAPKPLQQDSINWDKEREACIEELRAQAIANAKRAWRDSIATLIEEYMNKQKCFSADFEESFSVRHETTEHHYTLYEYDLAGNLVLTIPPAGVAPLDDTHFNQGIWDGTSPGHNALHITKYKYNTLGQITAQITPDAGQTDFFFDHVQRLRFSQNAEQAPDDDYAYTKYDGQSRIIEVGELKNHTLTDADINDQTFPGGTETIADEVTTTYDGVVPPGSIPSFNTRGRVAKLKNPHMESYYDYDAHGNVRELTHIIPELNDDVITMQYDYDLISGNVNEFRYEPGEEELDKFTQRYLYDADNRLTSAYSSDDGYVFDEDARYFYYLHGPLARIELGEDKVQGHDYMYTLQGWIKGVNMPGADGPSGELGRDGYVGGHSNLHRYFGRDTMMYTLGYNYADFKPVGGTNLLSDAVNNSFTDLDSDLLGESGKKGLFNGNIALMITHNGLANKANQAMAYQYDALHRITFANSYLWTTSWKSSIVSSYSIPEIIYDANGNIRDREIKALTDTDILEYKYKVDQPNILDRVLGGGDVTGIPTQSLGNYGYDEIGNLISDATEGTTMTWDVFGKLRSVDGVPEALIEYIYDAQGNRMIKGRGGELPADIYIRDASGNLIAIYEKQIHNMSGNITNRLLELNVYGSSRLGVIKPDRLIYDEDSDEDTIQVASLRQMRSYELTNHLGNILTTISDQKLGDDQDEPVDFADYYNAVPVTTADYYPFGLEMPGRTMSAQNHRFGFNGKEKDPSLGSLTHYDYGFRIYNPAIGRFLSVDPLTKSYPMLTPYQFASNSSIANIDLDGLESYYAADGSFVGKYGDSPELRIITDAKVAISAKFAFAYPVPNKAKPFIESLPELSLAAFHIRSKEEILAQWASVYKDLGNRNTVGPEGNKEYGMSLYSHELTNKDGSTFSAFIKGSLESGSQGSNILNLSSSVSPIEGWNLLTTIHTHRWGKMEFSDDPNNPFFGADIQYAEGEGVDLYLAIPGSKYIGKFSPDLFNEKLKGKEREREIIKATDPESIKIY